jgi:undecaprenyl-diphosphatase
MPANSFDLQIVHFFNQFCGRSVVFDKAMVVLVNNTLLKGGILMILLWYEWFLRTKDSFIKRRQIISMLCGCFISMFTVRLLTKILPFRARPILEPDNHLLAAIGLNTKLVDNTNSFPSDHASLFFGLVAGMFYVSKRMGLFSLVYVMLIIVLPRIYLGWHYPTDIIGGAVIGIFFVFVANMEFFRIKVSEMILKYADTHPHIFYPVFFLLTYQIATLFEGIRTVGSFVLHPYTAAV